MPHTSWKSPVLLTAAALGAALASDALADGLPAPNRDAPGWCCFTWSGVYYGANAGAAWSDSHDVTFSGTNTVPNGFGSEIADATTPSRARLDWGTSFTAG